MTFSTCQLCLLWLMGLAVLLFIFMEQVGRIYGNWLFLFPQKRWRYAAYASVLYAVIFWGVFSEPVDFIYFQF